MINPVGFNPARQAQLKQNPHQKQNSQKPAFGAVYLDQLMKELPEGHSLIADIKKGVIAGGITEAVGTINGYVGSLGEKTHTILSDTAKKFKNILDYHKTGVKIEHDTKNARLVLSEEVNPLYLQTETLEEATVDSGKRVLDIAEISVENPKDPNLYNILKKQSPEVFKRLEDKVPTDLKDNPIFILNADFKYREYFNDLSGYPRSRTKSFSDGDEGLSRQFNDLANDRYEIESQTRSARFDISDIAEKEEEAAKAAKKAAEETAAKEKFGTKIKKAMDSILKPTK